MKKIFVFAILATMALSACFGQATGVDRRLLGTWTCVENTHTSGCCSTWTFNNDGTFSFSGASASGEVRYAVIDSKLVKIQAGVITVFSFWISSDGRNIVLERTSSRGGNYFETYWLVKN